MNKFLFYRSPVSALLVITLLGACLRFYNLESLGLGNLFYAATVRSMGESLHNFFYAAFDPAGTISVDKPPLALWLQVISTKIFGFNAYGLIGPMVLASTLSIPITFLASRRGLGITVGLVSALVIAIFPESIATSRDSTMDGLLMLGTVLSAWILITAVEKHPRLILVWGLVMGLLFNIKFFEGFVLLPAAAIYILIRWREDIRGKAFLIISSGLILLLTALAWIVWVDFLAFGSHPQIMNDPNGSALSLAFLYNGIERVLPTEVTIFQPILKPSGGSVSLETWARLWGVGDRGLFRLFTGANASLIGFSIVLGFIGLVVSLIQYKKFFSGPGIFWAAWFLTGVLLFSFSNRAPVHYIESFAPAIAVMAGYGLVNFRTVSGRMYKYVSPIVALAALGYIWMITDEFPGLRFAVYFVAPVVFCIGCIEYIGMLRSWPRHSVPKVLGLLLFPLLVSLWIISFSPRSQITIPNPVMFASADYQGKELTPDTLASWRRVPAEQLISMLPAQGDSKYRFGIDGINNAGEAIAFTGSSILPVWNEYWRELMITDASLRTLLSSGDLPYILMSQSRFRLGLLNDLTTITDDYCTYDPRLNSVKTRGWIVLKCD